MRRFFSLSLSLSLGLMAAGMITATPTYATPSGGDAAYERGDVKTAVELWKSEAAGGSMFAMLQLGLAYDLGMGVGEDKFKALLWYIEAAEAGHPEAQFNVGVMLDSGLAISGRNIGAASVWYARAAANGHARAQYNLGLLYEAGEGVPQNSDLAGHWFGEAAAQIPAANEKLNNLRTAGAAQLTSAAPTPLQGALFRIEGWQFAELVWTAAPGPEGSQFLVEVVALREDGAGWTLPVASERTDASSVSLNLEGKGSTFAWRVVRIVAGDPGFVTEGWRHLGASEVALPDELFPVTLRGDEARGTDVQHTTLAPLTHNVSQFR